MRTGKQHTLCSPVADVRLGLVVGAHATKGITLLGSGPITCRKDPDRDPPPSTLTAIVSGKPFPAIQDMIVNIDPKDLWPYSAIMRNVFPEESGNRRRALLARLLPPPSHARDQSEVGQLLVIFEPEDNISYS